MNQDAQYYLQCWVDARNYLLQAAATWEKLKPEDRFGLVRPPVLWNEIICLVEADLKAKKLI